MYPRVVFRGIGWNFEYRVLPTHGLTSSGEEFALSSDLAMRVPDIHIKLCVGWVVISVSAKLCITSRVIDETTNDLSWATNWAQSTTSAVPPLSSATLWANTIVPLK